jgi:hypothetical protein
MLRCVARTKRRRESRVSVGGLLMVKPLSGNLAGISGQQSSSWRSQCHRIHSSEPSVGPFGVKLNSSLEGLGPSGEGICQPQRAPPLFPWYHRQQKGPACAR